MRLVCTKSYLRFACCDADRKHWLAAHRKELHEGISASGDGGFGYILYTSHENGCVVVGAADR